MKSRDGFFSVAIAGVLVGAALLSVLMIGMSARSTDLIKRRIAESQARYAVDALLNRTLIEVYTARLPASAWAGVVRTEAWGGRVVVVRVFSAPYDAAVMACFGALGFPEGALDSELALLGGVEEPGRRQPVSGLALTSVDAGVWALPLAVHDGRGRECDF